MKTYQNEKRWIWQVKNFPNFIYTIPNLEALYYNLGQLNMIEKFMNENDSKELLANTLAMEALSTSAIEGEILQRSSVQSSINKILKLGLEDTHDNTYQTDALIEIIIDAKSNLDVLDKHRLKLWHKALFPYAQSGLKEINSGVYRTDTEDMQIVSGSWEKEKVHYIAPSADTVNDMMEDFLSWLNEENETNYIIKAAIAHLYFVLIHPFDDGNGRITRAITDYILSKSDLLNANFYSIATAINKNRKEYYSILDTTCKSQDLDITLWIEWFIKILNISISDTLINVDVVKIKTKFWDRHKNTKLNDRQKKVISKMISYLPEKFEGGMKVKKYVNFTKTTRITANRDLSDLVQKNIMNTFGSGRGVYYELIVN